MDVKKSYCIHNLQTLFARNIVYLLRAPSFRPLSSPAPAPGLRLHSSPYLFPLGCRFLYHQLNAFDHFHYGLFAGVGNQLSDIGRIVRRQRETTEREEKGYMIWSMDYFVPHQPCHDGHHRHRSLVFPCGFRKHLALAKRWPLNARSRGARRNGNGIEYGARTTDTYFIVVVVSHRNGSESNTNCRLISVMYYFIILRCQR